MNDKEIEQEIQLKRLTEPRVTLNQIEDEIVYETYFTADDGVIGNISSEDWSGAPKSLRQITICVLVLRNGTKIVGVNTGPVSPENFDAELGRTLARQHAIDQIWPLMGYALREKLTQEAQVLPSRRIPNPAHGAPRPPNHNPV